MAFEQSPSIAELVSLERAESAMDAFASIASTASIEALASKASIASIASILSDDKDACVSLFTSTIEASFKVQSVVVIEDPLGALTLASSACSCFSF